ncbi:hypothetical protein PV326_004137 [Microctonus aethiopoides]|nr:hypothetical protein PV326_004137 [Microctonus aethiopoides]
MKYHFIFFCALLSILIFQNLYTVQAQNNKQRDAILTKGMQKFSAEYLKILTKTQNDNFISSPLSIGMVLALAAYGADANTKKQLTKALNIPIYRLEFIRYFFDLNQIINYHTNFDMHFANGLLVDNKIEINDTQYQISEKIFNTRIETASFEDKHDVADKIYKWYLRQTDRKIIRCDNAGNAVYFEGKCLPSIENEVGFFESANEISKIQTVCSTLKLKYNYILNNQILVYELPFETKDLGNRYSMFIFLPSIGTNLEVIYNNLHQIDFRNLFTIYPSICQKICIPKIDIISQFKLHPYLHEMKITDMFEESANFSTLCSGEHAKMANVIQKACFDIDSSRSSDCDYENSERCQIPDSDVTIEQPFVYAIVSKAANLPILWGQIIDKNILYEV